MADLYHVRFAVNSEPTSARFEFEENANRFADRLSFAGITAKVTDEFADRDENPVYVAEPDPLPNGLYLIADTPPTAHALAVEDGSGDRGLLREVLDEHDVDVGGGTVAERVFVVTDEHEPTVHNVTTRRKFAEAEKERFGGIVHEESVDHTRVDFDPEFPDELPHDLSEGDEVRYVRPLQENTTGTVTNVRDDGHVDLAYHNGDERREVVCVPPKHDGNDGGYEPVDEGEE